MATKLFMTSDASLAVRATNIPTKLDGTAALWFTRPLSVTAGIGTGSQSSNTVTGPTNGIEAGQLIASGRPMEWLSEPVDADTTISGTITINVWAFESAMAVNATINVKIDHVNSIGTVISEIAKSTYATELGTSSSVHNFTVAPTSTTLQKGDRIRVTVFFDDGGGTMASGTATFRCGGTTNGADGDSYISFTETFGFLTTAPAGSTLYLTDTAGPAVDSSIEKEMWTSRGSGVASATAAINNGPMTPVQMTISGTVVEWYSKPLTAFTLSGLVTANVQGRTASAGPQAGLRAELAVCDGNGSNAVVWAAYTHGTGLVGTADTTLAITLAGDDVSVSAGQRLRLRVYADDYNSPGSTTTVTLKYGGTSGGGEGDSFIKLSQTVSEHSGANTYEKVGALIADTVAAGADASELGRSSVIISTSRAFATDAPEYAEIGSIIAATLLAGARLREFAPKAGSIISDTTLAGADAATLSRIGSAIAGTLLAGADISERVESGSLIADTLHSGADASTFAELGSLVNAAQTTGADATAFAELGATVAAVILAGTSAKEASAKPGAIISTSRTFGSDAAEMGRSGAFFTDTLLVGADVSEPSELGSLVAGTVLAGTDVPEYGESGALITKALATGADESTYSELGAVISQVILAGVSAKEGSHPGAMFSAGQVVGSDVAELMKLGSLLADTHLVGSDISERSELGSLIAAAVMSATDAVEYIELGALITQALLSGISAEQSAAIEKAGAFFASAFLAGIDAQERVELGSIIAGTVFAGLDAPEYSELGSIITASRPFGLPTFTANLSGTIQTQTILSSPSATEHGAKFGTIFTVVLLAGADSVERYEFGTILANALHAGIDAEEWQETGSLVEGTTLAGVSQKEQPGKSGALLAAVQISGIDASERSEPGSLLAGTTVAGADTVERTEIGSIIANTIFSGTDIREASETGVLSPRVILAGVKAQESTKGAYIATRGLPAGIDALTLNRVGAFFADTLHSGIGIEEAPGKSGAIAASGRVSASDAAEFAEMGSLITSTFGTAVDQHIAVREGAVVANGKIYGADVFTSSKTGAIIAVGELRALRQYELVKAGSLFSQVVLSGTTEEMTGYLMTGDEIHILTNANIEEGRITSAEVSGETIIVATIPNKARITKAKVE
jgi:hypothetical protein